MDEEYVATNVRLPKAVHRALKHRAVEEDKSLAAIIRESVTAYLARPPTGNDDDSTDGGGGKERDGLWLIGANPTQADVKDGSQQHDRYLYGQAPGVRSK